ncbi:MAG TPA: DUF262 domain-containing protein [Thermoanaerobaculia bacterium]|nr:DUF262 domain-containing protein [Thermoanaerobaculia bacterium]
MQSPPRLPRKPEARTEKVEDLVERVRRGFIRVPRFQRGLKWKSSDVVELFDSLYRGYPIGSLLFYKRSAKADRLPLGPLIVDAPETSEAWWVVDGQQRVTALAVCLTRPVPVPARPSAQDPFVLFFDAESQKFEPPPATARIPSTWVPVSHLLDATQLTEWVYTWQHRDDGVLRRVVFDAGARLREYAIPLYLIETEDTKVAEEIFYRINQAGSPLEWKEVHKALFGGEGSFPSTLPDLSEELADIGMGRLDEGRLLTCLFALRGLDPTRSLAEHYRRDPEVLRGAVQEALPVLRRVLSFLRKDAGIPHLRLLPKSILLDVLTRFFLRNEDPSQRTRTLLARWFWRTLLGAGSFDDRTLRRRGIAAVGDSEEKSVQELLRLVRKERPRPPELPEAFDARADESRIALLALSHLGPRHLASDEPIDIAGLLEEQDKDAFLKMLVQSGLERSRGAANRVIHPKGTPIHRLLRDRISAHGMDDPVLRSHAIDARAAELLAAGDLNGFLAQRSLTLTAEVRRFSERMAAWDHNDRPSVDYLLAEAGVEV